MASPQPRPRARRLRAVRLAVVAGGLGLLLATLPLPNYTFAPVAVGAHRLLPAVQDASAAEMRTVEVQSGTQATGDRVAAADTELQKFNSIGLTFDRRPDAPVFLRTQRPDGGWDPWQVLPVSADEGPDGTSTAGTDPVWTGGAVGYEVNLGRTDAKVADVVTVVDEMRRSVADTTSLAGAAVVMPLTVHSRTEWGARATSGANYASTLKLAVVHHSASGNTYTQAQVPSVLRSIQAYHMDGRGWSDIAYNFVVDKFGTIWEGRGGGVDRLVIGAHAMGFNTSTVGVMVLGDYSQPGVVPGAATVESVSKVIGWKFALHGIDPTSRTTFTSAGSTSIAAGVVVDLPRVVGHKDVGATGCPGSIYNYLGQIRNRSQDWTNWIRAVSGPSGAVESVTMPAPGTVKVAGYAVDPDLNAPAKVRLTVGSQSVEGLTSLDRPDVQAKPGFASAPLASGFELTVTGVPPGYAEACTKIVDQGSIVGDAGLGCAGLRVADPAGEAPTGTISSLSTGPGTFAFTATVADAQGPGPYTVDVLTEGQVRSTLTTNGTGSVTTRLGGQLGGARTLCVRAHNVGAGADTVVDCVHLQVPGATPRGQIELLSTEPNGIRVAGWVVDDETGAPVKLGIWTDGVWRYYDAGLARTDKVGLFPLLGIGHGFNVFTPLPKGAHTTCVLAKNVGLGTDLGMVCKRMVVK